jgi:glycosyltransferase involved in cell wall biosynthesis
MDLNQPRVSIGVPVRNGERFLAEALDSLLAQTFTDFELLISDNASSDQTEVIGRDYAAKDKRVRYYRCPQDVGLANNFNYLFLRSRGAYFKWAAGDDVHDPDYVARCVEVLDQDPTTVLAYAKARFIDQEGNPLDTVDPGFDLRSEAAEDRLRYVIRAYHWVNAIFGVVRRSALANTRLLPSYASADYTLLGELAAAGKFVEVPDSLFRRRLHPAASSQNRSGASWMVQFWTGSGGISLPLWSRSRDHFATILRADLKTATKISLCATLARSMVWRRQSLAKELRAASLYKLHPKA